MCRRGALNGGWYCYCHVGIVVAVEVMDTSALPHAKPRPRAAEKAAAKRRQAKADRAVYAAVTARDLGCCRACGVLETPMRPAHRHHIRYRSRGGETSTENVCLLCAACHSAIHAKRLRIVGTDANQPLQFISVNQGVLA